MTRKKEHLLIILFSLIICLAGYQIYVAVAAPQVPFMDTIRFLVQIDQILKGEISWFDAYGKVGNVHRGLIYPFVTLIEWIVWGIDSRITTILTGFVVPAIFFYWLRAFLALNSLADTKPVLTLGMLGICFFSALIVSSPAAFELWTLDLGFAQLLKNLLIVIFLFHVIIRKKWVESNLNAFASGALGAFLILFATYGWSYPLFAAASFGLLAHCVRAVAHRKRAAVVFTIMLVAQAIYVYSGMAMSAGIESTNSNTFSISNLLGAIFYGAGTVFIGGEVITKLGIPLFVPIVLGALLIFASVFSIVITLMQTASARIFLCSLVVFSLVALLGIALARASIDFTNAGASRYFVDFIWLLLCPLAIILTTNKLNSCEYLKFIGTIAYARILRIFKVGITVLFMCAIFGHLITWIVEFKTAPYRALAFERMASVYRNGVVEESDAILLQSPYETAKKAIEVAQRYNLSNLRYEKPKCSQNLIDYAGDWFVPEQNYSRWMGRSASISISKCAKPITLHFFIPREFSARQLQISYDNLNKTVPLEPGKAISVTLAQTENRYIEINFAVDSTSNPFSLGLNDDKRDLGLLLTFASD